MRFFIFSGVLGVLLLVAAPARAATALDTLRANARAGHAEVTALRERQAAQHAELNEVSQTVAALKTQRRRGLPTGADLTRALQRTQELSGELGKLARDLSDAEMRAERADLTLLDGLGSELAVTQQRWETSPSRTERQSLLATLRTLRAERRRILDATGQNVPRPEIPDVSADASSEDPADLLEQSDALRDSEDKARERLKLLDTRIAELRQERDLDRRMNEFVGDDQLFDEQTRRLRVTRNADGTFSAAGSSTAPSADVEAASGPARASAGPSFASGPGPDNASPAPRASDHPTPSTTLLTGHGSAGDERALTAEREKLRRLAEDLEARAKAIEARAKSLR